MITLFSSLVRCFRPWYLPWRDDDSSLSCASSIPLERKQVWSIRASPLSPYNNRIMTQRGFCRRWFQNNSSQHGPKDRHNEIGKYLRVSYNAAEFESIQVKNFFTWVACAWSFPLACQRQVPSSSSCNRINVHGMLSWSPCLFCARRRILSSPWGAYNQPSINTFKPKTHLRKASALPKWHPSAHLAISAIAVPLPPPISHTSL